MNHPKSEPTSQPAFWVVIPAAGVGLRMGADRPKQYLEIHGRTVLEHTLACFDGRPDVRGIVLSIAIDDPWWPQLVLDVSTPVHLVPGGAERADSVLNALNLLAAFAAPEDWVLVHDAARPCLRSEDIDRLIAVVSTDAVGGILGIPVRDTMKRVGPDGRIQYTESRDGLWHALTPQMFRLGLLRDALKSAREAGWSVTDEASAIERTDRHPLLVEGRADNIKITRPEDLALAEFFLAKREEDER